jgi:phosphatidylinositol kinase/protein kinase (PI-3  family)
LIAGYDCELIPIGHRLLATNSASLYSFKILITGDNSGLVETITDAVSVHSIKKSEYARRITEGNLGNVTLLDHYVHVRRARR